MDHRPPTLPPCDLRSGSIEAIYAGRFAILQWQDFCATAMAAFGDQWLERTAELRQAGTARRQASDLRAARETYETLLRNAPGRLGEEVAHHRLLSQQPLWGFLNGVALAERLHLNHLEIVLARGRVPDRASAKRALGHAFRCHLVRRTLYREIFPVVEAMHAIDGALRVRRPRLALATFGVAYGQTAEDVALAGYERVRASALSLQTVEAVLASVLAPTMLARDPWNLFLAGARAFQTGDGTRLAAAALHRLATGSAERVRERSWSLASFLAWYGVRGNGGLVPGVLRWRLVAAYIRALFPVVRGLVRRAPYAMARSDLPALWTHAPEGSGLILDPAALSYGARTLAHPGLENTNPLLPHGVAAESGYAIDQYILRKAAEYLADPEGRWSHRLEAFLVRWTHASGNDALHARLHATLRSIAPETMEIARAVSLPDEERRLQRGWVGDDVWEPFMQARSRLLHAVEEEWHTQPNGPLATILGSYYIHGL